MKKTKKTAKAYTCSKGLEFFLDPHTTTHHLTLYDTEELARAVLWCLSDECDLVVMTMGKPKRVKGNV